MAPRGQLQDTAANDPAAILAARRRHRVRNEDHRLDGAATLVDPGPRRVRVNPDGTIPAIEATTATYCQGVFLGASVELAERDRHPRWADRATAVLHRHHRQDGRSGPGDAGFDDGGDVGLFNGILARYLADAAVRRPARRAHRVFSLPVVPPPCGQRPLPHDLPGRSPTAGWSPAESR